MIFLLAVKEFILCFVEVRDGWRFPSPTTKTKRYSNTIQSKQLHILPKRKSKQGLPFCEIHDQWDVWDGYLRRFAIFSI